MIKFSKKQLSMSLFVLALNTLSSNSFATDLFLLEETEGELGNSSSAIINTETKTLNFEDIYRKRVNVGRNDTINILDVDFQNTNKIKFLNKILEGKNNLVYLIITSNTRFINDGVLSMRVDDLPINLKHLSIKDKYGLVTQIGGHFLYRSNITSFDSRGLENVEQIGILFLSFCKNLTSFDSRGLENVTQIKNWFLSCSNLTFFDSRRLNKMKKIESGFLDECENLISIDLRGLENVIKIECLFLSKSPKLKEIRVTSTNLLFLKKNLPKEIKDLIEQKKTVFLIQNEDIDIEERASFVQENYTQQLGGLIHRHDNGFIQIKTKQGLLLRK